MRPTLRYVNHKGRVYDFEKGKIWPLSEALYDFDISYKLGNSQVISHSFDAKEIPLSIAMNPDDSPSEMNLFYDILMDDVLEDVPGRLYDGAWYIECLLKKSDKRYWYRDSKSRTFDLALWAPDPCWCRDVNYSITAVEVDNEWLSYPHGYPHDYGFSQPRRTITIDTLDECDFKLTIFGSVANPSVAIGDNLYTVKASIPEGGRVEIDSRAATVKIITPDGFVIDAYSATPDEPMGSGSYIFEPIKPGIQDISHDGSFNVSLTVYERSQERRWLN